ncbi:helix-turn-helix transcriptional regulator [Promicromonospora sukumoe]|uniref:Transcriptional regulator with XRE-family HTH domain n=1 Tax=Promicromonospora sukumoe TaxID=88382 RepID=A0A7W3PDK2_9MICO|nr:helix-turn-helix transcriptional regulator [Promicromonospora sukumoe]MBA8807883.1 transcriptional regulator with XRE-family HTH domain [Promicromonospora sukumoe]
MTDQRQDVRDFLTSRRARVRPEESGLPSFGSTRRVPGLRREEVALLAGVSVEYYARMERGNLSNVSDAVLEAVARALQLDEAEHAHLFDLARAAPRREPRRRRPAPQQVRPVVQRILEAITDAPAWIRNGRQDILAMNELGRALYQPVLATPQRPANAARFTFLDPAARQFLLDWEKNAADTAAALRQEAGRNPDDPALINLIGELSTRSEDFRVRWATHDVLLHRTGVKRLHHPVVGELELSFESFDLPADPGLVMVAYSPAPGSPSADSLALLATWAATTRAEELRHESRSG